LKLGDVAVVCEYVLVLRILQAAAGNVLTVKTGGFTPVIETHAADRTGTGVGVGWAVGLGVGRLVGFGVGRVVGAGVGAGVGESVGVGVGVGVTSGVALAVGSAVPMPDLASRVSSAAPASTIVRAPASPKRTSGMRRRFRS
jgi:hypothetical protein